MLYDLFPSGDEFSCNKFHIPKYHSFFLIPILLSVFMSSDIVLP